MLIVGKGAKNDSITLFGELVSDECLHTTQKERRQEVEDKFLCRYPRDLELIQGGIMRLANPQRFGNGLIPLLRRAKMSWVCPIQEGPQLGVVVLNGSAGKTDPAQGVDLFVLVLGGSVVNDKLTLSMARVVSADARLIAWHSSATTTSHGTVLMELSQFL